MTEGLEVVARVCGGGGEEGEEGDVERRHCSVAATERVAVERGGCGEGRVGEGDEREERRGRMGGGERGKSGRSKGAA